MVIVISTDDLWYYTFWSFNARMLFLNFLMYIGNLHLTINYYYYYKSRGSKIVKDVEVTQGGE